MNSFKTIWLFAFIYLLCKLDFSNPNVCALFGLILLLAIFCAYFFAKLNFRLRNVEYNGYQQKITSYYMKK